MQYIILNTNGLKSNIVSDLDIRNVTIEQNVYKFDKSGNVILATPYKPWNFQSKDFIIEYDIRIDNIYGEHSILHFEGGSVSFGIKLAIKNNKAYYLWHIATSGNSWDSNIMGNVFETSVPRGNETNVISNFIMGEFNNLKFTRKGNMFSIYCNGQLIVEQEMNINIYIGNQYSRIGIGAWINSVSSPETELHGYIKNFRMLLDPMNVVYNNLIMGGN